MDLHDMLKPEVRIISFDEFVEEEAWTRAEMSGWAVTAELLFWMQQAIRDEILSD